MFLWKILLKCNRYKLTTIRHISAFIKTKQTEYGKARVETNISFHPPILISFSASSIRPHPARGACPDESRHTGSTSTAAALREYRLSVQRQGKPALATRYPQYWGLSAVHPHACAFPFHHTPSGENTVIFFRILRLAVYFQICIPKFQLLRFFRVSIMGSNRSVARPSKSTTGISNNQ